MIFRDIKITGQDTLKVRIPENWDDVSFKEIQLLTNEKDELKRLTILTGIPFNLWDKYPDLADFYVWVSDKLLWANSFDEEDSNLEVFILEDEIFNFPKDVGVLSIGLYKDIQSEAHKNKDNILSIYPLICASYYQIMKDGEYDYSKAEKYVGMFEDQPCKKVYNSGGFFLSKVKGLKSGMKTGARNRVTRTIRSLLGSIGFQRYSGLKLYPLN